MERRPLGATGEELSIIGFDDIQMSRYVYPALTTVGQSILQLGEMAAEVLLLPESIDTPDPLTVVFKMKAVNASMLEHFASPWNTIYAAKDLAAGPVADVLVSGAINMGTFFAYIQPLHNGHVTVSFELDTRLVRLPDSELTLSRLQQRGGLLSFHGSVRVAGSRAHDGALHQHHPGAGETARIGQLCAARKLAYEVLHLAKL